MAVTITNRDDPELGAGYEIAMSASGDAVQIDFVVEPGHPNIMWRESWVHWYKTASVNAFYSAGPRSDLALTPAPPRDFAQDAGYIPPAGQTAAELIALARGGEQINPPALPATPTVSVSNSSGSWLAHERNANRTDVERSPLTGLRFVATGANQQVVVWTRSTLRRQKGNEYAAVQEVTGV